MTANGSPPSALSAKRRPAPVVTCDCPGYWSGRCNRPARWRVNSPAEPQTKWLECDYHAAESRKRAYVVRRFRPIASTASSGGSDA